MTHLYHLTLSDETHCGNCLWPSVMVFQGCHHKIPLAGLIKTTKLYCLPVLEARSLSSRCWEGCFLLRVNLFHTSLLTSRGLKTIFGLSLASSPCGVFAVSTHSLPSAQICVRASTFHKDISYVGLALILITSS